MTRRSRASGIERLQALTGHDVAALDDLLGEQKHPAVRLGLINFPKRTRLAVAGELLGVRVSGRPDHGSGV